MLLNRIADSDEYITVSFLSESYTFPGFLRDYAIYLNEFEEVHNCLFAILNDQIKRKEFGCNSPNEEIYRTIMEEEGQTVITALSKKGIYNVTLFELVQNTKGYKAIRTVCQNTLDELKAVMLKSLYDFMDETERISRSATSRITGSGVSVWTNRVSSMLLYSAMEVSTIRKQCNAAEKEYSSRMDELCRENDDQTDRAQTEVLTQIYYPGIAEAINMFCSELFQNFLKILDRNGLFDYSITKTYDLSRSANLLENLPFIEDQMSVLKAAFLECPYNPDLYMALLERRLGDLETFDIAKVFQQGKFLRKSVSEYCTNHKTDDIDLAIHVLSIYAGMDAKEIVSELYHSDFSEISEKYDWLRNMLTDRQETDRWIRSNITENTSDVIAFDESMIRSSISNYFNTIEQSQNYKIGLKYGLIRPIDGVKASVEKPLMENIVAYIDEAKRRKAAYEKAEEGRMEEKRKGDLILQELESKLASTGLFAFSQKSELKKSIKAEREKQEKLQSNLKASCEKLRKSFVEMYR